MRDTEKFHGSERVLVEGDCIRGAVHVYVRNNRIPISVWSLGHFQSSRSGRVACSAIVGIPFTEAPNKTSLDGSPVLLPVCKFRRPYKAASPSPHRKQQK